MNEDDLEEAFENCGYMPDEGICSMAGSEFCEFECPLQEENERHASRKAAWVTRKARQHGGKI